MNNKTLSVRISADTFVGVHKRIEQVLLDFSYAKLLTSSIYFDGKRHCAILFFEYEVVGKQVNEPRTTRIDDPNRVSHRMHEGNFSQRSRMDTSQREDHSSASREHAPKRSNRNFYEMNEHSEEQDVDIRNEEFDQKIEPNQERPSNWRRFARRENRDQTQDDLEENIRRERYPYNRRQRTSSYKRTEEKDDEDNSQPKEPSYRRR